VVLVEVFQLIVEPNITITLLNILFDFKSYLADVFGETVFYVVLHFAFFSSICEIWLSTLFIIPYGRLDDFARLLKHSEAYQGA